MPINAGNVKNYKTAASKKGYGKEFWKEISPGAKPLRKLIDITKDLAKYGVGADGGLKKVKEKDLVAVGKKFTDLEKALGSVQASAQTEQVCADFAKRSKRNKQT